MTNPDIAFKKALDRELGDIRLNPQMVNRAVAIGRARKARGRLAATGGFFIAVAASAVALAFLINRVPGSPAVNPTANPAANASASAGREATATAAETPSPAPSAKLPPLILSDKTAEDVVRDFEECKEEYRDFTVPDADPETAEVFTEKDHLFSSLYTSMSCSWESIRYDYIDKNDQYEETKRLYVIGYCHSKYLHDLVNQGAITVEQAKAELEDRQELYGAALAMDDIGTIASMLEGGMTFAEIRKEHPDWFVDWDAQTTQKPFLYNFDAQTKPMILASLTNTRSNHKNVDTSAPVSEKDALLIDLMAYVNDMYMQLKEASAEEEFRPLAVRCVYGMGLYKMLYEDMVTADWAGEEFRCMKDFDWSGAYETVTYAYIQIDFGATFAGLRAEHPDWFKP